MGDPKSQESKKERENDQKQIKNVDTFHFFLFSLIKFRNENIQHQKPTNHPQVRWRQQTLPAVYFESEQSPTESATTNTKTERSANPGSVKWSCSVQSSHGTSIHSSFDTLEGKLILVQIVEIGTAISVTR